MDGMLTSVDEVIIGSDLDADVAAGATTVSPTDIDSFHAAGGTAVIGDLEGTNEPITYGPISTDEDGQLVGPLTLSAPLANAYTEDSGAGVYLTREGAVLKERRAYIQPELQDREQAALVPTTMWDRVPLGTRDPDQGERAYAEYSESGNLMLTSLDAQEPQQTGEFIDPITAPHPHDGEPPGASPTPEVIGGVGTLFISWEAIENNDPVFYDVHISDSSGFTPDATTFAGQEIGTMTMLRGLPDTTPFALGTDYYVKLIARDVDGAAPESAEASGQIEAVTPGITATDGSVPASSPQPTVVGGPTYLAARWTPIANPDPVRYEVHISPTSGFTPSGASPGTGTFYGETAAGSMVINKLADGSALAYGTTYYVKIVAKDADGKAGASTQGSGVMAKVDGGVDILARSIVAGDIVLNTLTGNEILADSVNADRITTNTLTADRIQTGTFSSVSIFSDKVVAGAVAADRLVANSISAGQINAIYTVSNLFRTASSGKRVEFDANGVRLYNPAGSLIVDLNSNTGAASFAGSITASTMSASTIDGTTINLTSGGVVQSATSHPKVILSGLGFSITNSGGGTEVLVDTNGVRMLEAAGLTPGSLNKIRWINPVSGQERMYVGSFVSSSIHTLLLHADDGTRNIDLAMWAGPSLANTKIQLDAFGVTRTLLDAAGASSFGQLGSTQSWTGDINTFTGGVLVTGGQSPQPTSGAGVYLEYNSGVAYILGYDFSTPVARPLAALGSTVDLIPGGGSSVVGVGRSAGADTLGFFNATKIAKQTVTGSRGGIGALGSLIAALAGYGMFINSTTA